MNSAQILSRDPFLIAQLKKILLELEIKALPDCGSAKSLFESFPQERPQILLLDSFIRDLSPFDVIKKLNDVEDNLVMIFLIRQWNASFVDKAFRLGATDVIPVPFTSDFLKHTIMHRCESIEDPSMIHFNNP